MLSNIPSSSYNNLDGLSVINADEIYIGGEEIQVGNYVPYTGATKTLDMGSQAIQTTNAPTIGSDVINLTSLLETISYVEIANALSYLNKTTSTAQTVVAATTFNSTVVANTFFTDNSYNWPRSSASFNAWGITRIANGGQIRDLQFQDHTASQTTLLLSSTGQTVYVGLTCDYGTASKVPIWNASKQLVSSGTDSIKISYLDNVSSDIQTQINAKASITYVDSQNNAQDLVINGKASTTYVDSQNNAQDLVINSKASTSYVDSQNNAQDLVINGKASTTYVDSQNSAQDVVIATKASTTYVDSQNNAQDLVINSKASISYVDSQDNLKANLSGGNSFSGQQNYSDKTLSTVAVFDASKNLSSSAISTTELNYLGGVSSNIQTQLDTKATTSYVNSQNSAQDVVIATKAATTYVDTADGLRVLKAGDTMTGTLSNTAAFISPYFYNTGSNLTYNETTRKNQWWRIIKTGPSLDKIFGEFIISYSVAGQHGFIQFRVGACYASNPTISIVNSSFYGTPVVEKLRLSMNSGDIYADGYVDMFLGNFDWYDDNVPIKVNPVNQSPFNSDYTIVSTITLATSSGRNYYEVACNSAYEMVDASTRFKVNNGKVSVNTASPTETFEVSGTSGLLGQVSIGIAGLLANTTANLKFSSSSCHVSDSAGEVFLFTGKQGYVSVARNTDRDSTSATLLLGVASADESEIISRATDDSGYLPLNFAASQFVFVGGSVGIGAIVPRASLDVAGDIITDWGDRWIGTQYLTNTSGYFLGIQTEVASRITSIVSQSADSPATGAVVIKTGSGPTERMRITAEGNVGIGTTDPANILTVATATSNYGFSHTDGTITVASYVGGSSGGGWYGTTSKHNLNFYTNDSSAQITLKVGGNLGIGTIAPLSILHIARAFSTNGDYSGMISFENTTAGGYFDWQLGPQVIDNTALFSLRGGTDGFGGLTNFISINGNGRVGIGTTNPTNLLDVSSNTRSGTHATDRAFYATRDAGQISDGIAEFRHSNGTAGVGIGWGGIYATGTNANNDMRISSRGTGKVYLIGETRLESETYLQGTPLVGTARSITYRVGRDENDPNRCLWTPLFYITLYESDPFNLDYGNWNGLTIFNVMNLPTICNVLIQGFLTYYTDAVGRRFAYARLYHPASNTYYYPVFTKFFNIGGNHEVVPINKMFFNMPAGSYDMYFFTGSNVFVDINDRVYISATVFT